MSWTDDADAEDDVALVHWLSHVLITCIHFVHLYLALLAASSLCDKPSLMFPP